MDYAQHLRACIDRKKITKGNGQLILAFETLEMKNDPNKNQMASLFLIVAKLRIFV